MSENHDHDATEAAFATVEESAKYLNLGRSTVYGMINRGEIQVRRFGRCVRIPWSWLRAQTAPTTGTGSASAM